MTYSEFVIATAVNSPDGQLVNFSSLHCIESTGQKTGKSYLCAVYVLPSIETRLKSCLRMKNCASKMTTSKDCYTYLETKRYYFQYL